MTAPLTPEQHARMSQHFETLNDTRGDLLNACVVGLALFLAGVAVIAALLWVGWMAGVTVSNAAHDAAIVQQHGYEAAAYMEAQR